LQRDCYRKDGANAPHPNQKRKRKGGETAKGGRGRTHNPLFVRGVDGRVVVLGKKEEGGEKQKGKRFEKEQMPFSLTLGFGGEGRKNSWGGGYCSQQKKK